MQWIKSMVTVTVICLATLGGHYTGEHIREVRAMKQGEALVWNVVDGDTFDAFIYLGYKTYRLERIRVLDFNAPEKRMTKGVTVKEYALGQRATKAAREMLQGRKVTLAAEKQDSFGRYLATVTLPNGDNFAERMRAGGYFWDD